MTHRLKIKFYSRDTHTVAKELLGRLLIRVWHGKKIIVRINEVECYVGEDDQACHASRGRTPRTEIMYGEPGHAYIYLIYGMYYCLNIVTEQEGFPAAVLIRGAQVTDIESGIRNKESDKRRDVLDPLPLPLRKGENNPLRPPYQGDHLLNGPGKICRALRITRAQNGEDLTTSHKLYIADDGFQIKPTNIITAPRINVDYAGEDAKKKWRYLLK